MLRAYHDGRKTIECLRCGRVSHNENDVGQMFCGFCHRFHEW